MRTSIASPTTTTPQQHQSTIDNRRRQVAQHVFDAECPMRKQRHRRCSEWFRILTRDFSSARRRRRQVRQHPPHTYPSVYRTSANKKSVIAVAHCKSGKGLVKVNGKPLYLLEPQILRFKVYEPLLILGLDKFGAYDPGTSKEPCTNILKRTSTSASGCPVVATHRRSTQFDRLLPSQL